MHFVQYKNNWTAHDVRKVSPQKIKPIFHPLKNICSILHFIVAGVGLRRILVVDGRSGPMIILNHPILHIYFLYFT